MHAFLSFLVFIFILCSVKLGAMDKPCYVDKLSLAIVAFNGDFDLDEFLNLSELNNTAHALFNENTWFFVYKLVKGKSEKVRPELTYKQNCQVLNRAYALCHTAPPGCPIQTNYCYVSSKNKIDFCELSTATAISNIAPLLAAVEQKPPLVFVTCFGPFYEADGIKKHIEDFFDSTFNKDILLIIPAGNSYQKIDTKMPDYDIRQRWPHVLWVSRWNSGERTPLGNYGPLIQIGAPSPNGTSNASLGILPLVIQMRRLRLDLSAAEIIEILVASASVNDDTKLHLPNGGIVNAEEAVKALLSYERTPSL